MMATESELSGRWVCAQLGAREHYAVARALHGSGRLAALVTDAWVKPGSILSTARRRLGERFHPGLKGISPIAWNWGLMGFELRHRFLGTKGWERIIARNRWFGAKVLEVLEGGITGVHGGGRPVLFSYSYAGLEALRWARREGWVTVLGQIDPGPQDEEVIRSVCERSGVRARDGWRPAPASYWEDWREECSLADRIVVNSRWSKQCLLAAGIDEKQVEVVPLAYEEAGNRRSRHYPDLFSEARPLRVLFLGQVSLRKGIGVVLEAAALLAGEHVEFWVVGATHGELPGAAQNSVRVRWFGSVTRGEVGRFYGEADVFLFPTHSDGFGLTQLEALAHGLPVIASRFCGEVVEDGVNGLILDEVDGDQVAGVLKRCLREIGLLDGLAQNARLDERFSLQSLQKGLEQLIKE